LATSSKHRPTAVWHEFGTQSDDYFQNMPCPAVILVRETGIEADRFGEGSGPFCEELVSRVLGRPRGLTEFIAGWSAPKGAALLIRADGIGGH
jgi:hypothetical protein